MKDKMNRIFSKTILKVAGITYLIIFIIYFAFIAADIRLDAGFISIRGWIPAVVIGFPVIVVVSCIYIRKIIKPGSLIAGYLILTVGVSGAIFGAGAIISAVTSQQGTGFLGYTGPQHDTTLIYDNDLDETYLIFDGRLLDERIDGRAYIFAGSEDGSVNLAVVYDEHQLIESVYCIKGGYVTRIENKVSDIWISNNDGFSLNGETAFVLSDHVLYSVGLPDGERNVVADGININTLSNTHLSRDGKGLLYVYKSNDPEDELYWVEQLYYYRDGKNIKIGNDLVPIAVSNNEEIYFYDREQKAFCYMAGSTREKKMIMKSDQIGRLLINKDQTQLLLYDRDEQNAYFIEKGRETSKVSGLPEFEAPIKPQGDGYFTGNINESYVNFTDRKGRKADDLKHCLYVCNNENREIWYLNGGSDPAMIASDVQSYRLSKDSKTFFYLKAGDLYRVRIGRGSAGERIASGVLYFEMAGNGNTVYYVSKEAKLFYIKGSGDAIEIADGVAGIAISQDDTLFYVTGGRSNSAFRLYSCTSEKDWKFIADKVFNYSINPTSDQKTYSVRISDHKFDVYAENYKGTFARLLEGVSISFSTYTN